MYDRVGYLPSKTSRLLRRFDVGIGISPFTASTALSRVRATWQMTFDKGWQLYSCSTLNAIRWGCCCYYCCDQRHRCHWLPRGNRLTIVVISYCCVYGARTCRLITTKLYMPAPLLYYPRSTKRPLLRYCCYPYQWRTKILWWANGGKGGEDSEKTRWRRRGRTWRGDRIPNPVQWWELDDERRKFPWWKPETSTVENGYVSFRKHSGNGLAGV